MKRKNKILLISLIFSAVGVIFLSMGLMKREEEPKQFVEKKIFGYIQKDKMPYEKADYVPGEIIVKFKGEIAERIQEYARNGYIEDWYGFREDLCQSELGNIFEEYSITEARPVCPALYKSIGQPALCVGINEREELRNELRNTIIFKLRPGVEEDATKKLNGLASVEYAEPNYIYKIFHAPDDPYYYSSGSWGQGYNDLWGIRRVNCEGAWDVVKGLGITVAVIDTGIDYNHEDISVNVWTNEGETPDNGRDDDNNGYIDDIRGWDFSNNDNDPLDDNGHGTHVAGSIDAVGDNGIGVVGVAYQSRIMAIKGLRNTGEGTTQGLVNSILYAVDNGAKIINCSWGNKGSSSALEDAINYAYSSDCLTIAAAGNFNKNVRYYTPANIDKVIAVAATDYRDRKAAFSNYGMGIDVSAPGVNILSLRADGTDMYGDGSHIVDEKYYWADGTSMACPYVAGAAAMILSNNPNLTPEEVGIILKNSCDDIEDPGFDENTGYGRINVTNALNYDSVLCVEITSPRNHTLVTGPTDIRGTVVGNGLIQWTLAVKRADETNWREIASGSSEIQDGILVSGWNDGSLLDGDYYLYLSASDGQHTFRDYKFVYINNSFITPPIRLLENAWWYGSYQSPVHGDLNGDGVEEIITRENDRIFAYKTNGDCVRGFPININNFVTPRPILGISGVSISDLDGDGELELVISVIYEYVEGIGFKGRVLIFRPNGNIKNIGEEFSIRVPIYVPFYLYMPVLEDLNLDGSKEIIVTSQIFYEGLEIGKIVILDHKGEIKKEIYFPDRGINMPAVGDVNGDGYLEIAVTEYSFHPHTSLHVYDSKGFELPGWPVMLYPEGCVDVFGMGDPTNHLEIGDIDRDGIDEIAVQYAYYKEEPGGFTFNPRIGVFNGNGTPLDQPFKIDRPRNNSLLGNFYGDRKPEICFQDARGIEFLNWEGRTVYEPIVIPGVASYTLPVIVDFNNDGINETIIATSDGKLTAVNPDGETLQGWPKMICPDIRQMGFSPTVFFTDNKIILAEVCMTTSMEMFLCLISLGEVAEEPQFEWPMLQHDSRHTGRHIGHNEAPEFEDIGNRSVYEGEALRFEVRATDPDGDNVTLGFSPPRSIPIGHYPEFSQTSGNPAVGSFYWIPGYEQAGSYHFIFTAADGRLTTEKHITITVINVNRPPEVDLSGNQLATPAIYNKVCYAGGTIRFVVEAEDMDGDEITEFSFYADPTGVRPDGATFRTVYRSPGRDLVRKEFSWTPAKRHIGRCILKFYATAGGLTGKMRWPITIEVKNPPRPRGLIIQKQRPK